MMGEVGLTLALQLQGWDTWDAFHKGDRMAVEEVFGVVVRPLADVAGYRIE